MSATDADIKKAKLQNNLAFLFVVSGLLSFANFSKGN